MTNEVRAWVDPSFRATLGADALNQLPDSPVGSIELSTGDLDDVRGADTFPLGTCYSCFTCRRTFFCGGCG